MHQKIIERHTHNRFYRRKQAWYQVDTPLVEFIEIKNRICLDFSFHPPVKAERKFTVRPASWKSWKEARFAAKFKQDGDAKGPLQ